MLADFSKTASKLRKNTEQKVSMTPSTQEVVELRGLMLTAPRLF